MKKKLSLLLCILLLLPTLILTAAAQQDDFVIDNAGLFSGSEEDNLENQICELRSAYQMDIVILTEETLNGERPQDHADDYYDAHGYAEDGILFLLSMAERDWYISTCGNAIYALTDYGIQAVTEDVIPYLSEGNYYGAFETFLQALPEYLEAFAAGAPIDGYADYSDGYYHGDQEEIVYFEEPFVPSFELALLAGIIVAAVSVLIMRLGMNSVKRQHSAGQYLSKNTYRLTGQKDLFLYSKVTKTRKPQNSSSSGGGSSVHRSSSGRSHGGGGGKF
jgi:uncharacterized protein